MGIRADLGRRRAARAAQSVTFKTDASFVLYSYAHAMGERDPRRGVLAVEINWEETTLLPSRPMHLPLGGNPQAGIGEAIHSVKTHSPLTERAVVRLTAGRTDGRTECINRLRKSVSRATLPSLARLSWR